MSPATHPASTTGNPQQRSWWRRHLILRKSFLITIFTIFLILSPLVWLGMKWCVLPAQEPPGPPPVDEPPVRDLARILERDLRVLSVDIGERLVSRKNSMEKVVTWLERELATVQVRAHREIFRSVDGTRVDQLADRNSPVDHGCNLVVDLPGTDPSAGILVVGAHYDSIPGCPAANDNGTGVVALLELVRRFAGKPGRVGLRLVFWANEEPPYFHTEGMGSLVNARGAVARKETLIGAIALETMGYFSDQKGSQRFPVPMLTAAYGDVGDFISFVGNTGSKAFIADCLTRFGRHGKIVAKGGAFPGFLPGIDWSDHWAYEKVGIPGFMVTDTAPFRYPHYHTPEDTIDKIDFRRLALVVEGLTGMIRELIDLPARSAS